MNSLLFPSRVDWYSVGVDDHHNASHNLVLLKQGRDYDWHDVKSILVVPLKLRDHNQEFIVSKYSTGEGIKENDQYLSRSIFTSLLIPNLGVSYQLRLFQLRRKIWCKRQSLT